MVQVPSMKDSEDRLASELILLKSMIWKLAVSFSRAFQSSA